MSKWEMVRLGDVVLFINGDRGKNYPSSNDFVDCGIPFVNAGHLVNNKVNFDDMNYISSNRYDKLGSGKLEFGDILYCLRGSLGKKAIVDFNKGAIASSLVILRPDNRVLLNNYLSYCLDSKAVYQQQVRSNNGSSQPNLSASNVKQFLIPLPPIEIQKQISNTLDTASELISLRKQQLEELDNLIKSVFYDMFGDPMTNEKYFKKVKLDDICDIARGGSPRPIDDFITEEDNGVNWIKIGDADDSMYISRTKQKIVQEGVKKSRYVRAGDFILSNSMSFGRPYILKIDGCIHDGWLVLRNKEKTYINEYLYFALSSDSTYAQFKSRAVGGVVNNLNSTVVKSVKVLLPPLHLQNKFVRIVTKFEEQKSRIQKSIDESQYLFDSLMSKYFD